MTPDQWKEQLENQVPYTPNPENYKKRKKLPMPKTRYLLDKIFKKK
jgi:hypothetical protein